MKTPKTLIREYEATHTRFDASFRLYAYVRPRKNREANIEIWGARINKKRKGCPLMMKKYFVFHTDSNKYELRDVVRYTSYSQMVHDHLIYHNSDMGGRNMSHIIGKKWVGKWDYNYVSNTPHAYLPNYCVMLNGFEGTNYKYCAFDSASGLSVIEYINLYKDFPIAEIISKSKNFQLLTRSFLKHCAEDKKFASFVAKNHYQISLHHMTASNIETAFKRGKTCEDYIKKLIDARNAKAEKARLEYERVERERRENEMKAMRKWDKKIRALYNRIKDICGTYGCFEVEVPKSSADMYAESEAMHNCIGRCYTSNHATGHDTIIFLRKDGKPCVDLRINPETMEIVECRYTCNKDAMQDESVMVYAREVRDNLAKVMKKAA